MCVVWLLLCLFLFLFFFFNDTATTEIYTLSLHDALPISQQLLTFEEFTPAHSLAFLDYLSHIPSRGQAHRAGLVLCTTTENGRSTTRLSPPTINRIFAAVTTFYEYLIVSGQFTSRENPILKIDDPI